MPEVIRSIEIAAPPGAVWRHFATERALRRWLSPSLEIDLRVGGSYRLRGPEDDTWISGLVLELVPQTSLVLSWLEEGGRWTHPARLVITLAASERGTTVRLIHDGFEGIGTPDWKDTVRAYERGADAHRVLERLAELTASVRA